MSQPGHREVHAVGGSYRVMRRIQPGAATTAIDIRTIGWADSCPWLGGEALHTTVQALAGAVIKRISIHAPEQTGDDNFRAGYRTGTLISDRGAVLVLVWPSAAKEHVFRVQPQSDIVLDVVVDYDIEADAPGTV